MIGSARCNWLMDEHRLAYEDITERAHGISGLWGEIGLMGNLVVKIIVTGVIDRISLTALSA